jgi:hypothetical protein
VNSSPDDIQGRALVLARASVDKAQLADPAISLKSLVQPRRESSVEPV